MLDFIQEKLYQPPMKKRIKMNVYNSYTGARRDSECHFGSSDAQIQSTNDKTELQEQPRADDIDEEERDDQPDWEKMKVGLYF